MIISQLELGQPVVQLTNSCLTPEMKVKPNYPSCSQPSLFSLSFDVIDTNLISTTTLDTCDQRLCCRTENINAISRKKVLNKRRLFSLMNLLAPQEAQRQNIV